MPDAEPAACETTRDRAAPLHELLDERAAAVPDQLAYRFLPDGETAEETITYGGLSVTARAIAAALLDRKLTGRPVILALPPGNGFVAALFACWHAGVISVPAYPPRGGRHRRRLQAIIADSGARHVLIETERDLVDGLDSISIRGVAGMFTPHDKPAARFPGPCLLQYTSGSTASPKGVMISHENLRAHYRSLACYDELGIRSALSWLPPYHDMGLVLKILHAFEAGIPLTMFQPDHFIQRPARWLRAISRYRAELSGAPNFAFDACVRGIRDEELDGVDLSCWKAAPCGAERVRRETLDRFAERFGSYGFRPESFLPGYGLAETTLIVTATPRRRKPLAARHPQVGDLVSCGSPLPGVDLRIADPENGQTLRPGETGEIRLKAPVVSQGYWNQRQGGISAFGGDGELRTGDLGYLIDGELYVTGRIKDLIILDGANVAPEDIESVVMEENPEIIAAAAFAWDRGGVETVGLALEVSGPHERDAAEICRRARQAVADAMEIPLGRVLLVRKGLLPRTTSGKIRRAACLEAVLTGDLRIIHDDDPSGKHRTADEWLDFIIETIENLTGKHGLRADDDFAALGLGSLDATRLAAQIEGRGGIRMRVGDLFAAGNISRIAGILASGKPAGPRLSVAASGRAAATLSHAQERMWFLHQFDPASAAYHVFGAVELLGPLSIETLRRAYQTLVSRHEILRSRHGLEDGAPKVWIDDSPAPDMAVHRAAGDAELAAKLRDFARNPFELAVDSPIRALLVECGANRHVLAVCAHHIVADGWAMRLLARELSVLYAGGSLPAVEVSHADYAASHRSWVDGGAVDSQVAYWKSRLAGHSGVLRLPTDFPRPHKPSSDGGIVTRTLDAGLTEQIARIARDHRATPFAVHLAAFFLLLHQHGGGADMVAAIPVANRNHAAAADLVGSLVNTLPFRMTLDPRESFASLIEKVRDASFEMLENQDAPFERIIEAVGPERSGDHAPLAQVMFDHQEIPIAGTWTDGVTCIPHSAHRGATQFDLSMLLTVFSDRQQLAIEYRSDLFLVTTIRSLLERQIGILENISRNPQADLSEIIRLPGRDRAWLDSVSQGPSRPAFTGRNALDLIHARILAHPSRLAVTANGKSQTYQELGARSDSLATRLRESGVRPGDRVAILLERDVDLPAAILAIWKAGAAYVPLDRSNPKERLRMILDDQAPLTILASPDLLDHLPARAETIPLDEAMMTAPPDQSFPGSSPEGAAYVIHTSGTTGRPKGVVVSHAALANFLLSMAETPGFTEADRLLAVTTVSFDISCLELFLPLVTGGSVEIVPTAVAKDGHALLERLGTSGATVMQATPATWRLLLDAGWTGSPDLKILCGGEALDLPLARRLATMSCQLWNLYGPTETTVWSTCWRVPENPEHIRIGTPVANTGIHILSETLAPLPPGVPGGLWISGAGLADGYWMRPELTAERFATIPCGDGGSVAAYQTGDIARWHADGTLECLGRSDNQVKIRGFRVELGEIESVLLGHPSIAQAKAALRGSAPAEPKLVAWITLRPGHDRPGRDELRAFLAERLPAHMIPADIGVVDAFPLTASGKVDAGALPEPECSVHHDEELTPTEVRLGAVWCELLGRTSVHPDDNWFHVGGHSLLALRLFARIHQDFGRRIPLSAILDHPTPRALARVIDETPPS